MLKDFLFTWICMVDNLPNMTDSISHNALHHWTHSPTIDLNYACNRLYFYFWLAFSVLMTSQPAFRCTTPVFSYSQQSMRSILSVYDVVKPSLYLRLPGCLALLKQLILTCSQDLDLLFDYCYLLVITMIKLWLSLFTASSIGRVSGVSSQ